MSTLASSPSSGQSEVLVTLHQWGGGGRNGMPFHRLGTEVSRFYHGDDDREGSDSTWEANIRTAVSALQTAGYVVGRHPTSGAPVNLTSGTPPPGTLVILTLAGRAYARHPRPRARRR